MDSDEDEPLANISGSSALDKQARMQAEDAEIEAVRKRLLAARLVEQPDGELEKLQARQRGRIERHNSYRGGEGGGRQGGAMNDLMDLNFDGDSQENLPPTIQPNVRSPNASINLSSSGSAGARHGSLADYSDYDSEEDSDDDIAQVALASTSSAKSGPSARNFNAVQSTDSLGAGSTGTRGLSTYSNDDEGYADDDAASFASHQPQIGPQYSTASLQRGDADDDDDGFDPFADPEDEPEQHDDYLHSRDRPRQEYAAV